MDEVGEARTADRLEDLVLEDVQSVIQEVSPNDQMHTVAPDHYFALGQYAMRSIRIAMLAARKTAVRRILDLPCGHGRILRTLKAAFPDAELIACDINRDGVDFCAEVLGATPVYGVQDPAQIEIDGPVDLIWCGSLLTHLDAEGARGFLDLFESVLSPDDGLLVFTTHGRLCVERARRALDAIGSSPEEQERLLRGNSRGAMAFGLRREYIREVLDDFERDGFAFTSWLPPERREELSLPPNYGLAFASPAWICAELERRPDLRLVVYEESGWGGTRDWWAQDVVACVRAPV
jgi:SAM-dependent methyltransferase